MMGMEVRSRATDSEWVNAGDIEEGGRAGVVHMKVGKVGSKGTSTTSVITGLATE